MEDGGSQTDKEKRDECMGDKGERKDIEMEGGRG